MAIWLTPSPLGPGKARSDVQCMFVQYNKYKKNALSKPYGAPAIATTGTAGRELVRTTLRFEADGMPRVYSVVSLGGRRVNLNTSRKGLRARPASPYPRASSLSLPVAKVRLRSLATLTVDEPHAASTLAEANDDCSHRGVS